MHRRRTDPSPSPPPTLLSRLGSAASNLLQTRQYSSRKKGDAGVLRKGRLPSAARPDPSSWRCFDARAFCIPTGAIPRNAWLVLQRLKQKGFEAYLVGGCVRDLLLKRAPKDFDVITTASLKQIKKRVFTRCIIIGKRFPICRVVMHGAVIEVSSFSTSDKYVKGSEGVDCSEELDGYDEGDILLWKNSMKRDFTINSLFFNPFKHRIYDYVNGVRDLKTNKVCTVVPAHVSFKEDSARILRGLRIAARLGFHFSSETSTAIQDFSSSIIELSKARLVMEMDYLLSYGAAESSIRLLQKYGILDILLPLQAAYLSDQMTAKSSDTLMLMKLLANLDKLFSADRPCHFSLWLALLAFHSALVNCPQDAQIIKAFAAMLYFGTWESAIKFLKQDMGLSVPETLEPSRTKLNNLMKRTSHLASLVNSSIDTLTCLDALQQSLVRYPEASQFSGMVFISANERNRLLAVFKGLDSDLTSYNERRKMYEIDYRLLKNGHPDEVRFVLGKVIMDTVSGESPCTSTEDVALARSPIADLADELLKDGHSDEVQEIMDTLSGKSPCASTDDVALARRPDAQLAHKPLKNGRPDKVRLIMDTMRGEPARSSNDVDLARRPVARLAHSHKSVNNGHADELFSDLGEVIKDTRSSPCASTDEVSVARRPAENPAHGSLPSLTHCPRYLVVVNQNEAATVAPHLRFSISAAKRTWKFLDFAGTRA